MPKIANSAKDQFRLGHLFIRIDGDVIKCCFGGTEVLLCYGFPLLRRDDVIGRPWLGIVPHRVFGNASALSKNLFAGVVYKGA